MLTCPECCHVTLQKVKENQWQCEVCGTSFNFNMLRNALDALVGRQYSEDFIDELLGKTQLEGAPKLGERAWRWAGKHGILYTFDIGNSWHLVIRGQKHLKSNFNR
jgi:ribosomal protein L37AE/L43A